MLRQTLKFTGSAQWVTDKVQEDLSSKTDIDSVVVKRSGTSGTIVLHAKTREALDGALAYLKCHTIFKHHFKPA